MSNQIASTSLKLFLKLAGHPWEGTGHSQGQLCIIWRNWNAMLILMEQAQVTQLASFPPFIYMKDNWDGNDRPSTYPDLGGFPQAHLHLENIWITPKHLGESSTDHKREPIFSAKYFLLKYVIIQTSPWSSQAPAKILSKNTTSFTSLKPLNLLFIFTTLQIFQVKYFQSCACVSSLSYSKDLF